MLCVRRGALGDTILMIPALRMLRAAFPSARIEFAGNQDHAVLLEHYGCVDRAFSSEDLRRHEGERANLRCEAAYSRVFAEGRDFDPRIGPEVAQPAAAELLHRVSRRVPDAPLVALEPRLVTARVPAASPPLFVLAPGAGSPKKQAPIATFADRARRARANGKRLAVVLGECEEELAEQLMDALPPLDEVWRGLSAVELATKLARAHEFLGNDSGVTHLAAALLVPTTALFVATDPRVWAPAGSHVRVETT